jgi:hypothetical protein
MSQVLNVNSICGNVQPAAEHLQVRAEQNASGVARADTALDRRLRPAPLGALWARRESSLVHEGQSGTLLRCSGEYQDSLKQLCFAERQMHDFTKYLRLDS